MKPDKPTALIVLDGWGITNSYDGNAISEGKINFYNKLLNHYQTFLLEASSLNVGLPWGEVGNSEVGHVNIGAGMVHYQSLPRINKSIREKTFAEQPPFVKAIEKVKKNDSHLHVMGIIGIGAVHGHQEHLEEIIDMCKKAKLKGKCYFHLFLDGRDSSKDGGLEFVEKTQKLLKKTKVGEIASVCGRYWSMDRNKNWDRTEKAYRAIAQGQAENKHKDPVKAVKEQYKKEVFDEEFPPTVIVDKNDEPVATITGKDALIFFNYRADRARQITDAFITEDFDKFERPYLKGLHYVSFIEIRKDLETDIVFPPSIIENPIAKVVSDHGIKQLHTAETEKYAHVTFFINGLKDEPYPGEERLLVNSPNVPSYDQKPEMSAFEVTDGIMKSLKDNKFGFYIINFANPDMVGHTGNFEATKKSVEAVDTCIEKIVTTIMKKGGQCFLMGDHGNAEELYSRETGNIDKEHSVYPVPFICVRKDLEIKQAQQMHNDVLAVQPPAGVLADVAPTILESMGLKPAKEMTGINLLGGEKRDIEEGHEKTIQL